MKSLNYKLKSLSKVRQQSRLLKSRGEPRRELNEYIYKAVKSHYEIRRIRDRNFEEGLFSDTGWDILLFLYLSNYEMEKVSVGRACRASAGATTTALRWIEVLQEKGYLSKKPDPNNKRRAFLNLEPSAITMIEKIFYNIASESDQFVDKSIYVISDIFGVARISKS